MNLLKISYTYTSIPSLEPSLDLYAVATPTSGIYGSADTDLNHSGKSVDSLIGHELVPIVTMGENAMGLPAMTLSPTATVTGDMLMLDHHQQQQQQNHHHMQQQQMPPPMQLLSGASLATKVLTGVYTVSEEPELEAAETNSVM